MRRSPSTPACSVPSRRSVGRGTRTSPSSEPALKLVLIENPGAGGSLNHLGVEVASAAEVVDATRRLASTGLATEVEDGTTCCYALQDKVWVTGPGGERWEVYTVLADAPREVTTMSDCCDETTECCEPGCC